MRVVRKERGKGRNGMGMEKEGSGERKEGRKQVQWENGGREGGMGSRNQEVIGTSVKVHHRGQRAPIRL